MTGWINPDYVSPPGLSGIVEFQLTRPYDVLTGRPLIDLDDLRKRRERNARLGLDNADDAPGKIVLGYGSVEVQRTWFSHLKHHVQCPPWPYVAKLTLDPESDLRILECLFGRVLRVEPAFNEAVQRRAAQQTLTRPTPLTILGALAHVMDTGNAAVVLVSQIQQPLEEGS